MPLHVYARFLLALVFGVAAGATAEAQTIAVGSASGPPGGGTTPATVPVSFARNAAAPVADFVARVNYTTANLDATAAGVNGGNCSVNDTLGFVTVVPLAGQTDLPSNTYCNITFTIAAGAPAPSTQNLTLSFAPGGSCIDANADPVACNFSNGAITVTAPAIGPALAYNPPAGASAGSGGPVNFTGVTTAGSTGNGTITVTPSGGSGGGTTTLSAFTLSGADAAFFARTSAATLTFTAGVNTPQNVTLTCTAGSTPRTANLEATETISGGATTQRFWVLACPAGTLGPTLAYNPAAGASAGTGGPVNFTGVTTAGSTGNGTIAVTPSGGAGGATTTLSAFTLSGADAAFFARTSAATLTFTAGVNTPQNITLTCTSGTVQRTANLQATETITGGATTQRFWVLVCPAGTIVGPSLAYNPAAGASAGTGGPVNFTGVTTAGSTGNGTIAVTPSGGAGGGSTTLGSFTLSGADAAFFARTSAATLTFTAGVNTPQNITLTCTSGTVQRSANLQATETITGGATTQRFWVLVCPAGTIVGPSLAYNPTAGASAGTGGPVNFTGVTTVGSTGNGNIAVTPSGGAGGGTTTLGSFTLSGADAAFFARTSAATLTFTAGVNTPQDVTLTCTAGVAQRSANLQATETIAGGATTQRFWVLVCPAGGSVGPSLAYNPAAGASAGTGGPVNFTGVTTAGSTGNGTIAVTPSGGIAAGTTTLGSFTLSGADAAFFARTSAATLTFTAGINTPQNVTLTCTSGTVQRTANLQATETISGGATTQRFWVLVCPAGTIVGPSLAYNPAAGASAGTGGPVNFTGVTTAGSTGTGTIAATPSGGAGGGTTTLSAFTLSGADAAFFARTSAATLTFTAGVNTPQNITLNCTSAATQRTANLQATETITGGATTQRFWVLVCPAGSLQGPTLAYSPAAGASAGTGGPVNFTGVTTVGSTGNGTIVATPSGGAGAGTTTLTGFTLSGADAAFFARTSAATLTFTAGVNTPQNITLTCTAGAAQRSANLQATETITGGATTQRFWVLVCPSGNLLGPSLAYSPAAGASAGTGGPVNFTGVTSIGSSGNGTIVATPSGGAGGGTTTLTGFTLSGTDAAFFARTSAATLTFTAGVATPQNITLTCTAGAAQRSANLQATETITGGATTQRFWVLVCPAGAAPAGPVLSYAPPPGAVLGSGSRIDFTGNAGVGSTGVGVIVVTPSGGSNGGTSTLSGFAISGPDAGFFAVVSAPLLTFTAGVNTPQNVNLTCVTGENRRTAFLQATETITAVVTQRFWELSCVGDYFADGFENIEGVFADGFE